MSDVDFSGDDQTTQKKPEGEPTDFSDGANGEPNNQNTPSDGDEVVLEYEGRAFTKGDIAKKLQHSDSFIEQLKEERKQDHQLIQEVKEQLEKQSSVADVLEQLKPKPETTDTKETSVTDETQTDDKTSVDPDEIAKSVYQRISEDEQKKQHEKNWKDVTSKLRSTFGEKTNETVYQRAEENGLSADEAANLAKTKPQLFLRLFPELSGNTQTTDVHRSSTNPLAFDQQQQEKPKPSGYVQAKNDKERIQAYLDKLKQYS